MFDSGAAVREALSLLGAGLEAERAGPYEIVVIGGAAMAVIGIGIRPTKDIDVLALRQAPRPLRGPDLVKGRPLPAPLLAAAATVAQALGLSADWLNPGPADLLDHGLPVGFESRLTSESFGPRLSAWFPAREDLIYLKTFAAADMGVGRHTEDLHALQPSCEELLAGAMWARSQDPSEAFREMLIGLLRYFGCEAAAEEVSHG